MEWETGSATLPGFEMLSLLMTAPQAGKLTAITCTKITDPVVEKGLFYRGLSFSAERDLWVLAVIGRGKYMTFRMQRKDIRQHLENICLSAMSRIFKHLRLHGIIERV